MVDSQYEPATDGAAPAGEITDAREFRAAMNAARRGQVSDIVDVLRRTDLTKVLARRGVRSANGHDDVLIVRT